MPYIKQEERELYKEDLSNISKILHNKPQGHLTYLIFYLIREWISARGVSYTSMSQGIAAAMDAAAEIRRKDMDPYEDGKEQINGSI